MEEPVNPEEKKVHEIEVGNPPERAGKSLAGRFTEPGCDDRHYDTQQEAQDNAGGDADEIKQSDGKQTAMKERRSKTPVVPKIIYQEDTQNREDIGRTVWKGREAWEGAQE
jgi:hypothetical protein